MLTLPGTNHAGAPVMLDPAVQEIVGYLQQGYAPLGWAGDDRLGLYHTKDGRWELDRLGEDGVMRTICRSRPGVNLDLSLIVRLVEHDARRGRDAAEAVIKHNEDLQVRRDKEAQEALMEPMDKVLWGVVKDVGHLY